MLFTFPSRYWFTIGRQGVFRLGGWSPHVQTGFHVPRPTQGSHHYIRIRGYHPLWPDFPDRSTDKNATTGLLRFRSPLLAESRLMSIPPGTEMFQFPGFASTSYEFRCRYPKGVGCPIRTPRDQSLLAAPPRFSQRATSFFASWRQGIHQMPFSYSKPTSPRTGSIQSAASRQRSAVRTSKTAERKQSTPDRTIPLHTLHTHEHATHPASATQPQDT